MAQENDTGRIYPLLVLRDMVLMPGTTVHFDIQKEISIKAVNAALQSNRPIFVVTAKCVTKNDEVKQDQLYHVGTLATVRQILKLPKGQVRILLAGEKHGKLMQVIKGNHYPCANVELCEDIDTLSATDKTARKRIIKDLLTKCVRNHMGNDVVVASVKKMRDLSSLVDMSTEAIMLPFSAKQSILEELDLEKRVDLLISTLINELDIVKIRDEIAEKLKDCVNQNQKEYVLREQMKLIKQELGEENVEDEGTHYTNTLDKVNPPQEVREKLEKEIKRFRSLSYSSSESAVLRNYIETLLEYPWNEENEDNYDLNTAIDILEKDHYGLEKIKERIIDYLAVRILSNRKDAPILCLVGPPGTGKTSIAMSIARALNKEYARIALGGVRDEAEIRGHRKTYIGAMPGRIMQAITGTKVHNPLILLDEVDKTSSDHKGDVSSALLEVLDGEQNTKFVDRYFEVPVDLSEVLFVATANDASAIPDPLRDRMEIIEVNSYTENEKLHIAKLYLVKKQLKKNGLLAKQFKITDEALLTIIRHYTKEAGVRKLEQTIERLMQKAARGILTKEYASLRVTPKKLPELLGVEKYRVDEADFEDRVGVVTGLAWTKVGGDTLKVEVNILDGKGGLTLTGNLGDVMKESAQIALSFVRTLPDVKKLPEEYFEKHQIHVHVPEGATPKDGPSAGITMALAMYSALMNRPVLGKLAMTGEITLKGKVLPIGGLKEKLLAAKNAGMTKVCVPEGNRKHIEELEEEITGGLEIVYVSSMDEVIAQGIIKRSFVLKGKSN